MLRSNHGVLLDHKLALREKSVFLGHHPSLLFVFNANRRSIVKRLSSTQIGHASFNSFFGLGYVVHKNERVKACKKDAFCEIEVRRATISHEIHTARDFRDGEHSTYRVIISIALSLCHP